MLNTVDEYCYSNRENLQLPIERQLSEKLKAFSECFIAFLECTLNLVSQAGVKTLLLDNGFCTFFNNGNPVFSKGPRSLPRNPSDRTNLGK